MSKKSVTAGTNAAFEDQNPSTIRDAKQGAGIVSGTFMKEAIPHGTDFTGGLGKVAHDNGTPPWDAPETEKHGSFTIKNG